MKRMQWLLSFQFSECVLLLDCGANRLVVGNRELLTDLHTFNPPVIVGTANGKMSVSQAGTFGPFGRALFVKGSPNLVPLCLLEKTHTVFYKQGVSFSARLKAGGHTLVFLKDKSGLYTLDLKNADAYGLRVDTTEARASKYTPRELKAAERARDAVRMLGFPSDGGLAHDIACSGLRNNPITVRDLQIAADVHGVSEYKLKGSAVTPSAVSESMTCVPRVTDVPLRVYSDVLELESQKAVLSITKPMGLGIITPVASLSAESMKQVLVGHVRILKGREFKLAAIFVDPAKSFFALKNEGIEGVQVVPCGPAQHVSVVERYIRTVKERARAVIASLPWLCPQVLIKYLLSFVVVRLNQLCRRSVGNRSPFEQFTGLKLEFDRHVRMGFGDYVNVKVKTESNTIQARTRSGIALLPTGNLRGTHLFLSLDKGTVFSGDVWTTLPTPDIVVKMMNNYYWIIHRKLHDIVLTKRGDREGPAALLQKDNVIDPIPPPSDDKNFAEDSISHWPTEVPFETTVRPDDSGLEEGLGQKTSEPSLDDEKAGVETMDSNVNVDDDSEPDLTVPPPR